MTHSYLKVSPCERNYLFPDSPWKFGVLGMTNLQFEKARLPDGSRVKVVREGETIHIMKEDGSISQLPLDRYLHGLVSMVERGSDRELTGLEMTDAIVMAKWNKPIVWIAVIGMITVVISAILMWMALSMLWGFWRNVKNSA